VNTTARTVTVTGINDFSRWTASNTTNPIGPTATPTTTGITPASKVSGAATFNLTVNGTNFMNGNSVVRFNGSNRTTIFVSTTELTASIPASVLVVAGPYPITVFNSGGGGSSNAQTFTVDPGPLANFLVEAAAGGSIPAQSAGNPFNIKVTARDVNNNTVTGFTGTVDISSTGTLSTGSGTTASFVNGLLPSHTLAISTAGSITVTATKTAGSENGTSNAFTVNPGPLHHFLVEAAGGGAIGTHTMGLPFFIRVLAKDTVNNTVPGFTGTVDISSTGTLTSGSGSTASFSGGVLSSHSVTFSNTGSFTITATRTGGAETGTSNAFTVKNILTYYSQGSLDATLLSSWNSNRGGGGTSPSDFTSDDIFVLQNGHSMTTSAPWTVSGDGNEIWIESGATLTATMLVQTATFQIDNGGLYVHRVVSATPNGSSSDIPGSLSRVFGTSSTVEIRHWANAGIAPAPLPPNVAWGNLTINILDSIAGPANLHAGWNQQGGLRTINGNFALLHTGSPDSVTHKFVRLTDTTSTTLTIGGDLIIQGNPGEGLNFICCNGNGVTVTVNISGNYNQTGGFFESSTGNVTFNANNNPTMIFTGGNPNVLFSQNPGSFLSQNINWKVAAGKTLTVNNNIFPGTNRTFTVNGRLNFAPGSTFIDGPGNFVLSAGATLGIASTNGIDTGTISGNIRSGGTRTFSPLANYEFITSNGPLATQPMGTGFPSVVNNLTISNTVPSQAVTLNGAVTVNGALTINSGTTLDLNNRTLMFAGSTITNNGRLVGSLATASSSKLIFGGSGSQSYDGTGTVGTLADPLAALEINNSGSGLTINGAVTNLKVNRVNLLRGAITNSNKLTIGNSGAIVSVIQIGQPGGTVTGGSFDVSPTFSLGSGGLSLLYQQESTSRTAGFEIPSSRTVTTLAVDNSNGVGLSGGDLTVSGTTGSTLTLSNGIFSIGASNTVTIANGGNILAASGSLATGAAGGTVAFAGTGSVTGTLGFNNVTIAGGVNFGTGSSIGSGGTLTINTGGSVNTNPPLYNSGSLLKYNSGGTFGRGAEWSATSGAGYPANIQITNSTTLDLGNGGAAVARQISGNLQIDAGSTFSMNVTPMTASLTVLGSIANEGTLTLSGSSGGDLFLSGNLSTNGTFNANGRSVSFQGSGIQSISRTSGTVAFDYIRLNKSAASVQLNADVTSAAPAGGNSVEFNGTADVLDLNGHTLTLAGTLGGTNASGGFKGSSASSMILNGTGPMGTLRFTSGGDTLNNLTVNRTSLGDVTLGTGLTIGGTLTLTGGTFSVGSNTLALNGPAIGGTPANLQTTALSSLAFGGSAPGVTIPGSISDLNNLIVSNTSGVSCSGSQTVGGMLTVASGSTLTTGANTVTLGSTGTLAEAAGSTVVGTLTTTRSVAATSGTESFGNIGSDITLNGTSLGSTTITRKTGTASVGGGHTSILRYFDIAPSTNTGLNATLTFHYDNSELNGETAGGLDLYKSVDGGTTWTNRGGVVNTGGRTITVAGLDGFSRWTAADAANSTGPTPAPSISSISPTVKTAGDAGFTLTVNGTGFVDSSSVVRFDGSDRVTTYVSETQLTAVIPAGDLTIAGSHTVTVFNNSGGGASNGQTFTVLGSVANIKVFLQAPFSGSNMNTTLRTSGFIPLTQPYNTAPWNYTGTEQVTSIPPNVVDWVLIEIRTGTTGATRVLRRAVFVRNDGIIVDTNGASPVQLLGLTAGSYYVVVRHRNHLSVMSAAPVTLNEVGALYDFTTGVGQYFGGDAKPLGGGKFGMYAGDYSGDGFIDSDDFIGPDNEVFLSGYRRSDLNMDGFVDSDDFIAPDNNVFKSTHVPD